MNQKEKQEFSSAGTSINGKKVPAIFKRIKWEPGTKNLDWGGGKYDTACDYMRDIGCQNAIYDPYNRTPGENAMTLLDAPYDTATVSNVLNVIKEKSARVGTVENALIYLKSGGTMYIGVYEGDGSGAGRKTKTGCWQNNRKLEDYMEELERFRPVIRKHMIIITKEEKHDET